MATRFLVRRGIGRRLVTAAGAAALGAVSLAGPVAAGSDGPHLTQILSGYSRPVMVANTGESNRRIFIVEQTGKIRIATFTNGAWTKIGTFLDLTALVNDPDLGNEQGLLGLAFAPDYATSGRFYVNYTRTSTVGNKDGDTMIVEYRRKNANKADPKTRRVVMVIHQPYDNHNGGMIAFGPDDRLYMGMGDGGSGGDPQGHAQDLNSRLGKLLRINPRDPDGAGSRTYSVPSDNPFLNGAGHRSSVWALGLRNPWRWAFDRLSGDLWVGDVGQNQFEEVNHALAVGGLNAGKGVNYGWNDVEGLHDFNKNDFDASEPLCVSGCHTLPILEYDHSPGCAVSGGYAYRGPDGAGWQGAYLFGDYCSGLLYVVPAGQVVASSQSTGLNISGFGEDAAGRLFVTNLGGTVSLVTFTGTQ